jgi:pimeloyl-ACP methyl ester carboxylesterase
MVSTTSANAKAPPGGEGSQALLRAEVKHEDVGDAKLAYRVVGRGPDLLLVHGWPLSGLTFRQLVPHLSEHFTCHVVDLAGLGDSEWSASTDFRFAGHAERLRRFLVQRKIGPCGVLAQDTGATIARVLALAAPDRVSKLVLLNTEMPGHRPPWIQLFQKLNALPGSRMSFQLLMRSKTFLRSSMGFGGCFVDMDRLDAEFVACFIEPPRSSARRMDGVVRYLLGIEWDVIDGLANRHPQIAAPVRLIWSENDPTFPIGLARQMVPQFRQCDLVAVPNARLLLHEEQPALVAEAALAFLRA